jgi:hypothetical protein
VAKVNPKKRKKQWITESGNVLTEEMVEELADEAERGYDLSKWVPSPGRPPLGDEGPSPRISLRITPETFAAARRKAEADGVSLSEVAREAIRRYVGT